VSRHGTIFVGFCAEQGRLQRMLESMVGLGGGPSDRLTQFAHAQTGAYYFVPSADSLAAMSAA